jgi:hypothetical protein
MHEMIAACLKQSTIMHASPPYLVYTEDTTHKENAQQQHQPGAEQKRCNMRPPMSELRKK